MSDSKPIPARIRCIDWMRGLSVFFMIECHAMFFLKPIHDNDLWKSRLQQINGLLAPIFILTAGFSIGLVSGRAGNDPVARRRRFWRTLNRIGVVLIVSTGLKFHFWDVTIHRDHLWWFSILDCIAISLFITFLLLFLVPHRIIVLLILGLLAFFVAPFVESPRNFGWLTMLLNNSLYRDTWPLVPWAGYTFIGAILGLATARKNSSRTLLLGFIAIFLSGLLVSFADPILQKIYSPYNPYILTNAGARIWRIGFAGAALFGVEQLSTRYQWLIKNPFTWLIELFSRQSLAAFALHVLFLFGYWRFDWFNQFHQKCDWGKYVIVTLCLMATTAFVCLIIDTIGKALSAKRHRPA